MARVLITYGTTEGHTAKIAEVMADVMHGLGHDVQTADITSLDGTVPDGYDALVLGASIHMGKHDKRVVEFVRSNHDVLAFSPKVSFHGMVFAVVTVLAKPLRNPAHH